MKPNTLIISGGSTSGLMILGKLQQMIFKKDINLEEIQVFGGTSAGALFNFLFVLGFTPMEIINKLQTSKVLQIMNKYNLINFIYGKGMISLQTLEDELRLWVFEKKQQKTFLFKETTKKFVCTTFNFTEKKLEYLSTNTHSNMDMVNAVMMSCAIPLLFDPYIFENKNYIDGGILDNFPLDKTIELFSLEIDYILGLEINKEYPNTLKTNWNFKEDILPLLFSASLFFGKQQNYSLNNLQILKIKSTLPFYKLQITFNQICKLFLEGFYNNDDEF